MTTWRRRAALDAWIDQVESLLQQGRSAAPEPSGAPGASGGRPPSDAAVHPVRAERARGWMTLRAG